MYEHEETGGVGGSIDRARVKELYEQTDDPDLRAQYRAQLGDSEEGRAVDEAEGKSSDQPAEGSADVPTAGVTAETPQGEDLSSLTKSELVDRAMAAGIATEGKTKAELVADLGGST